MKFSDLDLHKSDAWNRHYWWNLAGAPVETGYLVEVNNSAVVIHTAAGYVKIDKARIESILPL